MTLTLLPSNMAAPMDHDRDKHNMELGSIRNQQKTKVKEVMFMSAVAGMSVMFGIGMTLAMTKKKDPNMFAKGLVPSHELPESGGALGMRALGWGTFYSITGVGLLSFAVWKMLGVHNLQEFRQKMGSILPSIPKSETPGKSDFKTIRELVHFVLDEDEKAKLKKKES